MLKQQSEICLRLVMLNVCKHQRYVKKERRDGVGGTVAYTKSALGVLGGNTQLLQHGDKDESHKRPLGGGRHHD